jgi:hypothetical protein
MSFRILFSRSENFNQSIMQIVKSQLKSILTSHVPLANMSSCSPLQNMSALSRNMNLGLVDDRLLLPCLLTIFIMILLASTAKLTVCKQHPSTRKSCNTLFLTGP